MLRDPVDHPFERLDPERFQQLCQSLLVNEYPGVQCLPVAQRDGGRDAMRTVEQDGQLLIYQIKFVRDAVEQKDPHKWLLDTMAAELPKVRQLIEKTPVTRYVLITNVRGTAREDVGSIDKLQQALTGMLPIPASAWWRTDLNARMSNSQGLRWEYPDLLSPGDMLQALLDIEGSEDNRRRTSAIRSFVTRQHELDENVKFSQVDLENDLLKLFVDVPTSLRQGPGNRERRWGDREAMHRIALADGNVTTSADRGAVLYHGNWADEPASPGAAALFLNPLALGRFPAVVLEGGPGQGKSTLAQFLCQAHRLLLLDRAEELSGLPATHRPTTARLPIRVDLREYASWVGATNPFAEEEGVPRTAGSNKSLESFLAALVSYQSGGHAFSVADLSEVVRASSVTLVLDGLDEVAEMSRREEVAAEIRSAVRRLTTDALSLQVIITTRPTALDDISPFPERTYHYFTLNPLTRPLILSYADRWARAQRLEPRAGAQLRKAFLRRLSQPHLSDLATNPMQLAILLNVIQSREDSLPEKRTELYNIYVEIFLARESSKSEVVREHRPLLLDVHGYLAWLLHSGAETGRELGRVDRESLLSELRSYLEREDHDPELAEVLFGGVTQRVVFIVQRKDGGAFEFEVQPLREYFAAKYLYETAPDSPPRQGETRHEA